MGHLSFCLGLPLQQQESEKISNNERKSNQKNSAMEICMYQQFVNWRCDGNFAAAAMWLLHEIWLFTFRAGFSKLIQLVSDIYHYEQRQGIKEDFYRIE